jgi:hypothetical protein
LGRVELIKFRAFAQGVKQPILGNPAALIFIEFITPVATGAFRRNDFLTKKETANERE